MGLAPGLLPPAPSPYSHPSLYTADPLHAELLAREAQRAAELQKGLDMHRWGRLPQFPGGRVTELCCRLVESQRLESLRQAEARATSFLSSFSKGEKIVFYQAPCRPLLLWTSLYYIIYCDDFTSISSLYWERWRYATSFLTGGRWPVLFSVSALSVRPRPVRCLAATENTEWSQLPGTIFHIRIASYLGILP